MTRWPNDTAQPRRGPSTTSTPAEPSRPRRRLQRLVRPCLPPTDDPHDEDRSSLRRASSAGRALCSALLPPNDTAQPRRGRLNFKPCGTCVPPSSAAAPGSASGAAAPDPPAETDHRSAGTARQAFDARSGFAVLHAERRSSAAAGAETPPTPVKPTRPRRRLQRLVRPLHAPARPVHAGLPPRPVAPTRPPPPAGTPAGRRWSRTAAG